jgi:hypothetical protein
MDNPPAARVYGALEGNSARWPCRLPTDSWAASSVADATQEWVDSLAAGEHGDELLDPPRSGSFPD